MLVGALDFFHTETEATRDPPSPPWYPRRPPQSHPPPLVAVAGLILREQNLDNLDNFDAAREWFNKFDKRC